MKPSKGYYCLVQYCPDLGRLEAANLGVLVFCPERGFLKAKTAQGNRRIRRFFGSEGHDWKRINAFKQGLEDRIQLQQNEIQTLEDLNQFIALRANLIQITPPRPMKVTDPDKDLDELFLEIVGEAARRPSAKSLRRRVDERISGAGLDNKVRRDISVRVPVLDRDLTIPFGFQNGTFNLINPVKFEAVDVEQSIVRACKYAVEGRSLFEHRDPQLGQLQLVIVGKFRRGDRESPTHVERILVENKVRLFRSAQLPVLIDEIRRTGRVLQNPESS